jgi:hypothetical protein
MIKVSFIHKYMPLKNYWFLSANGDWVITGASLKAVNAQDPVGL